MKPVRRESRWVMDMDENEYSVEWYETDDEGVTSCGIELLTSKYECPAGSSLDWALSHGGIQCDDVATLSNPDGIIPMDETLLESIENWRDSLDEQLIEFYDDTTSS